MDEPKRPGEIKDIVLIGSGKGGVGKTTVSVNLSVALGMLGRKVALLDADLYGPDVALMLGLRRTREAAPDNWRDFIPIVTGPPTSIKPQVPSIERFGLHVMSAAFLIGDTQAAKLGSNLMVGKILQSLLYLVDWGEADTLVIDLPPGSDEPTETIASSAEITGAIIVTTPQDVARLDAQREIKRYRDIGIRIMGMVENMSYFVCDHCGERQEVFHRGTNYADLGVPLLGQIPLDAATSELNDRGQPVVLSPGTNAARGAFQELAREVLSLLDGGGNSPNM